MTTLLFAIVHVVLIVALILLIIVIKGIAREIDELREELEHHRIKLKCLDDKTKDGKHYLRHAPSQRACEHFEQI